MILGQVAFKDPLVQVEIQGSQVIEVQVAQQAHEDLMGKQDQLDKRGKEDQQVLLDLQDPVDRTDAEEKLVHPDKQDQLARPAPQAQEERQDLLGKVDPLVRRVTRAHRVSLAVQVQLGHLVAMVRRGHEETPALLAPPAHQDLVATGDQLDLLGRQVLQDLLGVPDHLDPLALQDQLDPQDQVDQEVWNRSRP